MTEAVGALYDRLRAFAPGDVLEASDLIAALEKTIVLDETNFDDASELSRTLDEFSALVKAGVGADWVGFQAGLPGTTNPPPASTASLSPPGEPLEVDVEVLLSFLGEALEHLETIEERILSLEHEQDAQTVNDIFRAIHTIKGVSGFLNLQNIKRLSHELEYLLDELRSRARTADRRVIDVLLLGCDTLGQLVRHVADRSSHLTVRKGSARLSLNEPDIGAALEAIAGIRAQTPAATVTVVGEISDLLRNPQLVAKFSQESLETLEVIEQCILAMEKTRSTEDSLQEAFRSAHTLKGNAGFFGFQALETACMEMEVLLDALRSGQRALDTATVEALLAALDRLRTLIQAQAAPPPVAASVAKAGEAPESRSAKKKDIRVDTDKLDTLFDLIGELITAEAMVIDNSDLQGLQLDDFSRAAAYLSKITRELQATTMSIRMIPLDGLFGRMHRLVRDLGRKFGKEIELEISGAETEMDRNIIEEISDPLVHIIRNAIDHGIEDAATRKAKGKAAGRIRLNARYEGNEIWITVADDGAGLNRQRILEVARNKGLIGELEPSDAEVWPLIFIPGFSTAQQVSEISGRGVGMDVVKKNLEKLRGQVEIRSVKDQGTDFVLKIPLTLAIIDGVTLRSGSTLYSIPIADVVEFQNYQPERLTRTDPEHAVLRLRDEVIPVLPLAQIFVQAERQTEAREAKKVSIIVQSQKRKLALVVDEIIGYKQIVLKALPESMAGLQGLSGCTILGNGEVSLVIDVNAVFQRYLA